MARLGSIASVVALAAMLCTFARPAAAEPVVARLVVPESMIAGFSPDGRWLLAASPLPHSAGETGSLRALPDAVDMDDPRLCVYTFPALTIRACTKPGILVQERLTQLAGGVSWSADGETIVFSEGSPTILVDGDIWRMEVASGVLTNLTGDDAAGQIDPNALESGAIMLDTQPVFLADGSIAFARIHLGQGSQTTEIARIDAATGNVTTIVTLPSGGLHAVEGVVVAARTGERLWFTTTGVDASQIGLWTVDTTGANLRRVTGATGDRKQAIALLAVDPAEARAIVLLPWMLSQFKPPYYATVDLATGDATPLMPSGAGERGVRYVPAFAADGRILIVENNASEERSARTAQLVLRNPATGDETPLADELPPLTLFPGSPSDTGVRVFSPDLVAYPVADEEGQAPWAIVSLSGVNPLPATPVAGAFVPGMTVVTTAPTTLRATPALDAPIAGALERGMELIVIDVPVMVDGVAWLPVRDAVTGALGYVQVSAVTTVDPTPATNDGG